MQIKVVTACQGCNGPMFTACIVECTQAQYEDGQHYEAVESQHEGEGFDGPFVHFDENDGPAWLFEQFDWSAGAAGGVIVKIDEEQSDVEAEEEGPAGGPAEG